jgi:hypothetical protein
MTNEQERELNRMGIPELLAEIYEAMNAKATNLEEWARQQFADFRLDDIEEELREVASVLKGKKLEEWRRAEILEMYDWKDIQLFCAEEYPFLRPPGQTAAEARAAWEANNAMPPPQPEP